MEKILITGANGLLGGKIIRHLIDKTEYGIIAAASSEEKIREMAEREGISQIERIHYLSNQTFLLSEMQLPAVYGAVHLAFARRIRPAQDIAASLDFASAVFMKLASSGIDRVINLSSQGVYGNIEDIRVEEIPPAPVNHYTMAKYASEVIFNTYFENSSVPNHTNIRLDLVVQSQNLIPALSKQAKEGRIQLRGGEQRFSFIDAEDAADGVVSMLMSPGKWKNVYNLGWNRTRYTLQEIAEIVADVAEMHGYERPEIVLDKQDISLWSGMDSTRFMEHTGWKPKIDIYTMVERIFGEIDNERKHS